MIKNCLTLRKNIIYDHNKHIQSLFCSKKLILHSNDIFTHYVEILYSHPWHVKQFEFPHWYLWYYLFITMISMLYYHYHFHITINRFHLQMDTFSSIYYKDLSIQIRHYNIDCIMLDNLLSNSLHMRQHWHIWSIKQWTIYSYFFLNN